MRTIAGALLLVLSACGGCEGREPFEPQRGPVRVESPNAEAGDASGHPAYREAYDRANEEITLDNARERLETLNREIEKDTP